MGWTGPIMQPNGPLWPIFQPNFVFSTHTKCDKWHNSQLDLARWSTRTPFVLMKMFILAVGCGKWLKGLLAVCGMQYCGLFGDHRLNSYFDQRSRYLKNVSTHSNGLLGNGWWKKKRVGHVLIMNGALIFQWIVYLNRSYCHFKPPLGLLSFASRFVAWVEYLLCLIPKCGCSTICTFLPIQYILYFWC
jgi:hypothetical protein